MLQLNGDFAEAIALGSKTGCLPFVHASKPAVAAWVEKMIRKIDDNQEDITQNRQKKPAEEQLRLTFDAKDIPVPDWLRRLRSSRTIADVQKFIPWAAGDLSHKAFSNGQEAYWMLATNPFTLESRPNAYCPETMFGIWRHSLGLPFGSNTFFHQMVLGGASNRQHRIEWRHATYEGIVVAFADDITWVVENLNDANNAFFLDQGTKRQGVFHDLASFLSHESALLPSVLTDALVHHNAGLLYTYFIHDFFSSSKNALDKQLANFGDNPKGLRNALASPTIGLSSEASAYLDDMKTYLNRCVFSEPRVASRNRILSALAEGCLDLLYQDKNELLKRYIVDKGNVEGWSSDCAVELLVEPIHRIQLAVDVFCDMGDQEICQFVGIESL
jgi:hypothetical protein